MSKISRIERQLLAVAALSLALVAAVLGLGGLAVSSLDSAHLPVGHAPATAAGVYRVVTPVPTPFASPRPRVPALQAAAPSSATVSFRPPVAAAKPAPEPVARVAKISRKQAPKPRARRHRARKHASKPAPAPRPTAAVASVGAAQPAAKPVRTSPRMTRGNSGKPKVWKAPAPQPVHAMKPVHAPKPVHAMKPVHVKKPKPVPAAPAPAAAPPAHANNGRGHGVGGVPPGAEKAHGNGHGKGH